MKNALHVYTYIFLFNDIYAVWNAVHLLVP